MDEYDDYPRLGKDILKWSDLDSRLPILDLNIELFRRRNVGIASLVIISAILKADKKHQEDLFDILAPQYFDPKSLPQYLFEKIYNYLQENEQIPIAVLENWIPEYSFQVWGESPPEGRMLFGHNFTLRQIINFDPTEEQIIRAIELRKMVKEKKGY
ncbi:MAG: hypothetical protein WAV05_09165 [Anaerolineales bacterium]